MVRLYNWDQTDDFYLQRAPFDKEGIHTTYAFEQVGITVITERELLARDRFIEIDLGVDADFGLDLDDLLEE